jgi:hypothetical protein
VHWGCYYATALDCVRLCVRVFFYTACVSVCFLAPQTFEITRWPHRWTRGGKRWSPLARGWPWPRQTTFGILAPRSLACSLACSHDRAHANAHAQTRYIEVEWCGWGACCCDCAAESAVCVCPLARAHARERSSALSLQPVSP